MKGLYQFSVDFGRMGDLDGVFIAEKEKVAELVAANPELYFGEVLGKHSEVILDLEEKHIELLTDDPEVIEVLLRVIGTDIAGFNPIDYWEGY